MSIYIHKSHNVSVLIYHIVCPSKYRKVVFDKKVEKVIKEVCLEIEKRYEIHFIEIGVDEDHVHFMVQTVPVYSVTKMVRVIKSILAREVFKREPKVKKALWGGSFWTEGYYAATVGRHGDENKIGRYVKKQGKKYEKLYSSQIKMWE